MGIKALSEQMWTGEADLVHAHHPVRLAVAGEEIADRVFVYKGLATANTIDTGDGLVMLDTGGELDTAALFAQVRAWRRRAPLHAAVYSHHHVDHVFGTAPFEHEALEQGWPAPLVYAHDAVGPSFDRYRKTRGWNRAINVRQFALVGVDFEWPENYRYPDVTYRDQMRFTRGDLTFELHYARGETDDATWTYVPELKIVHPGDLFIWALPNAGNPQKVQRYVSDWASALRTMAACGAEILLAGHGLPIFGTSRVHEALTNTAELLDSLETQTLALMNEGRTLDEVIHAVEVPPHLAGLAYLQAVYDHPQFLVRNVWRRYGGWHDGEPDNLLPAPRAQQAAVWVELAGGTDSVLARAAQLAEVGDHRLACHLVEFAVLASPESTGAHRLRTEIYAARAAVQSSSMARNILNHAAVSSTHSRRDLAGPS